MTAKLYAAVAPGEVLLEDFLKPLGITQYRLAKTIGVPARRINEIVHGKRRITPDTALRLSKALGVNPHYWIDMQTNYDIVLEMELHQEEIEAIQPLTSAA